MENRKGVKMKIVVQQQPEHQDGVPGSVHLLLIGSDDKTKGFVSVAAVKDPTFSKAPEEFRIEVVSDIGVAGRALDFKVRI